MQSAVFYAMPHSLEKCTLVYSFVCVSFAFPFNMKSFAFSFEHMKELNIVGGHEST